MVLLKMLMKIGLAKMRGVLVLMMVSISPSGREVSPAESLRRRAKVLLPKFRLEAAALGPESPPLIFSRSRETLYRRWAPEVGQAEHNPSGRAQGGLARPGGLCPPGGPPPVVSSSSIFY